MDIGSLVQGLQTGVPAVAATAGQGTTEESPDEAFGLLLEAEPEKAPAPDIMPWQIWPAAASPAQTLLPMTAFAEQTEGVQAQVTATPSTPEVMMAALPAAFVMNDSPLVVEPQMVGGTPEVVLQLPTAESEAPKLGPIAPLSSAPEAVEPSAAPVITPLPIQEPTDLHSQPAFGVPTPPTTKQEAELRFNVESAPRHVGAVAISDQDAPVAVLPDNRSLPTEGRVQSSQAAPAGALKPIQAEAVIKAEPAAAPMPATQVGPAETIKPIQAETAVKVEPTAASMTATQVASTTKQQPVEAPKTLGYWRLVLAGAMDSAGSLEALPSEAQALDNVGESRHSISASPATPSAAAPVQTAAQPFAAPQPVPMTPGAGEMPEMDTGSLASATEPTSADEPLTEAQDAQPVPAPSERREQQGATAAAPNQQNSVELTSTSISEIQPDATVAPRDLHGSAMRDMPLQTFHPSLPTAENPDPMIRAASIEQVHTDTGQEMTEIRLDPEELGRLRITLEGEGDALRVRVEVERPETLDLLRRNMDRLADTLREAGYSQSDMQFSTWSGERQSTAAQPQPAFDIEAEPAPVAPAPLPSTSRPIAAAEGLNLRL